MKILNNLTKIFNFYKFKINKKTKKLKSILFRYLIIFTYFLSLFEVKSIYILYLLIKKNTYSPKDFIFSICFYLKLCYHNITLAKEKDKV